jgi:hypothetical protein
MVTFPWLGIAGIISALIVGKAWSSALPPSRSMFALPDNERSTRAGERGTMHGRQPER